MVITRTPFRISFFGGGTDYPVWYKEHGGSVLSTTFDKYCYITARYLPPFFKHKHRIVYSKIENVKYIKEIQHHAVREILKFCEIEKGVEIHHDGDLPARSGLGSSSAFTVGLVHSLCALKGVMIAKDRLAKDAIYLEREVLNENVGSQDQVAVAYGGFNKITFDADGGFKIDPITLKEGKIQQLKDHMMLFFTGVPRFASEIAAQQIDNTPNKKKELNIMKEMVEEAIRILNENRDLLEFGKLLRESWRLKISLSEKISNPQIDNIYDRALRAGAIGGKLLGAGGGGFILLFVPPQTQPKVRKALKGLLEVKFAFENTGSHIIYYARQEAVE